MPPHWPPNVCELCDTEVGDTDLVCTRCGHGKFVAGPSKRFQGWHERAVREASQSFRQVWFNVAVGAALFGAVYWCPMFFAATPPWAFFVQGLVVVVLAWFYSLDRYGDYISGVTSSFFTLVKSVSGWKTGLRRAIKFGVRLVFPVRHALAILAYIISLIMLIREPEWVGWQWAFPVAAVVFSALFITFEMFNYAVWAMGGSASPS
jgi:hypothetical protein